MKRKKINYNTPLASLSVRELKKITKLVIVWCLDHLGENRRVKNKPLEIELDFNPDEKYCGEYDREEDRRIIKIFINDINKNKKIKDLIATGLHEFRHDLQPFYLYDYLYHKYGYKNHPHEREARRTEKNFSHVCWEDIKHKVNYEKKSKRKRNPKANKKIKE
jgi:hypothetical protein